MKNDKYEPHLDSIYHILSALLINKKTSLCAMHNKFSTSRNDFLEGYTNVRVIFCLSLIVIFLTALFLESCLLIKSSVRMSFEEARMIPFPFHNALCLLPSNPPQSRCSYPLIFKGNTSQIEVTVWLDTVIFSSLGIIRNIVHIYVQYISPDIYFVPQTFFSDRKSDFHTQVLQGHCIIKPETLSLHSVLK